MRTYYQSRNGSLHRTLLFSALNDALNLGVTIGSSVSLKDRLGAFKLRYSIDARYKANQQAKADLENGV